MSETPQDSDAATQEGGYGYPTLEQEVTPEVLEAGAEADRADSADTDADQDADGGDQPAEPTD